MLPKLLTISFTEISFPYRILLLPVCSQMSMWVMQSLGPYFKNNSSSRFQISVTVVMLPGRNWTLEAHSFCRFAVEAVIRCSVRISVDLFLLVIWECMCVVFVFFFFSLSPCQHLKADMDASGCVYTWRFSCNYQRYKTHFPKICYSLLSYCELKWLHLSKVCLAQYTFFVETLKGEVKKKTKIMMIQNLCTLAPWKIWGHVCSVQLLLSDFSLGCCV